MDVLAHLQERHLNTSLHKVWLSDEVATFPLWNLSGQLVGYQQYRPFASKQPNNDPRNGRYFNCLKGDRVGVWGLESWSLTNTLFLTEGVFDAARLTSKNASAVALLSYTVSSSTKKWLHIVKQHRRVVAVCDNDASGSKLASLGTLSHTVSDYKDLGESSDEYVQQLLKEYL